jgi:ribonuclease E
MRRESRDRRDERSEETPDAQTLERDAPSTDEPEREEQRPPRVEPPSVLGPAVSLWHKIFGSPADQSAKIEEISSRQDEQEVTSDAGDDQSMIREVRIERERAVDDAVDVPARDELEVSNEPGFEGEPPEQGERRPRRSRRRRRGRGGKGEPTSDRGPHAGRRRHRSDSVEAHDEIDVGADDEDESDLGVSTDDEAGIADDSDSTEDGASRAARSRAALQRSIPSWDEAIGFIVEVNMQSRSQRRQSGQSNSPRGRSRGRRKN